MVDPVPNPSSAMAARTPAIPRVMLLCSFGGQIIPHPSDGHLCYAGGDTGMLPFRRDASLDETAQRLGKLLEHPVKMQYLLPDTDLDALVSVSTTDDLKNMIEEHDRIAASTPEESPKLHVFLFKQADDVSGGEKVKPELQSLGEAATSAVLHSSATTESSDSAAALGGLSIKYLPLHDKVSKTRTDLWGGVTWRFPEILSGSTTFAGRFTGFSLASAETLRVKREDGNITQSVNHVKYAQLTEDTVLLRSGRVDLCQACTAKFRYEVDESHNMSTNELVSALCTDADLERLLSLIKFHEEEDVRKSKCTLLLVDREFVCRVRVSGAGLDVRSGRMHGSGYGYIKHAHNYLNPEALPKETPLEKVVEAVKLGFSEASRLEQNCGGEVRIFVAIDGQGWKYHSSFPLPEYEGN